MPSTRPRPTQEPTKESTRTAIIVGLIIGLLGIMVLASVLYQRRLRRGAKAGAMVGEWEVGRQEGGGRTRRRGNLEEKNLEVGVIQEPLPVYTKEAAGGEKRLEMGVVR
ncbi:hypothetical protein G6011_03229 [Alternaria panax]|uniref:Uncharacterized protein n=1 Tax=Alternaria panax TaxID=48097 RepID=A0AAD4NSX8_9PLEO|nr:hypothetical protein G6011_03229 [Alternaria panax]